MMSHVFATKAEAFAAGYRRPSAAEGDRDISGSAQNGAAYWFGYEFVAPDGTHTVQVHLTEEPNKMGIPGTFSTMFPPVEEEPA